MMGHREKMVCGDEFDVVYARRWYCCLQKPGVCRSIKRKLSRRARQQARRRLLSGDWD